MEECKEGKVALLLGKVVKGVRDIVILLDKEVVAEKEGFVVWRANGRIPPPPLYEHLDTAHALLLSYFPN